MTRPVPLTNFDAEKAGGFTLALFTAIFLMAVFSASPAGADVGVGLHATANAGTLAEDGQLFCMTYTIYNPFDTDVNATLAAEGGIAQLVTRIDAPVLLPGRTGLENGKEAKICFGKKGAFGKACEPGSYDGSVAASITDGGGGTSASAQPLRLTVTCGENRNYYKIAAAIVALALALALL